MNKKSKNWLTKQKKDQFFKQSKIEGFRSRSAFKLIEMNQKFKFFKKKISVLDIGSCPGGWSQVASKEITEGKILAVDIKPMEQISNVHFIKGSVEKTLFEERYFIFSTFVLAPERQAEIICNPSLSVAIIFAKYFLSTTLFSLF